MVDKAATKLLTPKNQEVFTQLTGLQPQPAVITQKTKDTLTRLIDERTTNINNLLAGSGIAKPGINGYGASNAIAIQDLVKRLATPASMMLNGAGRKIA